MLKSSTSSGTIDKALELRNSQISAYNKSSLLYPSVDMEKLSDDQMQIIQSYIQEIKILDNELNKKSVIKATKMIDIKPYLENK